MRFSELILISLFIPAHFILKIIYTFLQFLQNLIRITSEIEKNYKKSENNLDSLPNGSERQSNSMSCLTKAKHH